MIRALSLASFLAVFASAGGATAQETLFNHPSADVLPSHRGYFELGTTVRFGGTWEGILPRLVTGVGGIAEVGINIGPFGSDTSQPYLVPNAKFRLFDLGGERVHLAGVAGARLYLPFSRESGLVLFEPYGFLVLGLGIVRLGGGAYMEIADEHHPWGFIASGEVAVSRRLTLAVEWWQERDLGMGVIVPLPAGVAFRIAYLRSPAGLDGDGIIVQLGFST